MARRVATTHATLTIAGRALKSNVASGSQDLWEHLNGRLYGALRRWVPRQMLGTDEVKISTQAKQLISGWN
jgi:hypothetical protein